MKKLVLALSAATLVVGFAAVFLWQQLSTERAQLADLRTRVTQMESTQAAAVASAAQSAPAIAATLPDNSVAALPSAPGAATSTNPRERMREGIAKGVTQVLTSPEGQDLTRNLVRQMMAQQYPDLASELRMTPAEAEQFMDLLARQASDGAGDAIGMLTGGNSPAALESQRKLVDRQLAMEKEISRTLGSKYPAWQEYQGMAAAKQQVSQLRTLLGTGEDALSEAKSKALTSALAVEQTRINKEQQNKMAAAAKNSQNYLEQQLKDMTAQNERLITVASPYLTINQTDRYKKMLGQNETMLRTLMGGMNAAGGASR